MTWFFKRCSTFFCTVKLYCTKTLFAELLRTKQMSARMGDMTKCSDSVNRYGSSLIGQCLYPKCSREEETLKPHLSAVYPDSLTIMEVRN